MCITIATTKPNDLSLLRTKVAKITPASKIPIFPGVDGKANPKLTKQRHVNPNMKGWSKFK